MVAHSRSTSAASALSLARLFQWETIFPISIIGMGARGSPGRLLDARLIIKLGGAGIFNGSGPHSRVRSEVESSLGPVLNACTVEFTRWTSSQTKVRVKPIERVAVQCMDMPLVLP